MTEDEDEWTPRHGFSRSGRSFMAEIDSLIDLFYFVVRLCSCYELIEERDSHLLDSLEGHGFPGDRRLTKPVTELKEKHAERLNEMMFCRCMDAFMLYVSDLVGEIFRARPECLRSSEKIEIDEVLRHKDMTSLREALGARKVEALSYQGAREVCGFLSNRLGLRIQADRLKLIVAAVEKRNVVVHARGIVTARFVERSGVNLPIGSRIRFTDIESIYGEMIDVKEFVARLDDEAVGKFELEVG